MEVLVLDVDDTLYAERQFVLSGFRHLEPIVEADLGLRGFGVSAWETFLAGGRNNIFDEVLRGHELPEGYVDRLVAAYRGHHPSIVPTEEVKALLRWAVEVGVPVAVLTDGEPRMQRNKAAALGLLGVADPIVVTDELGGPTFRKPHPAGYNAVMRRYPSVPPEAFLYVADNPGKDLSGARAAGWDFLRLRRHDGLHADIPSPPPAPAEAASLGEVLAMLQSAR